MKDFSTRKQHAKKLPSSPIRSRRRDRPSSDGKRVGSAQSYFRDLIENSLAAEYVVQNGHILFVNPALVKMFGYRESELVGRDPLVLIHPEDRPDFGRKISDPPKGKTSSYRFDCRGLRKDGHTINIEVAGSIPAKLNGRPVRVGSIMETTKERQASKQLQQLSWVVEQNPATVIITNARGRIEFVNPKFTQLTGYTLEEVKGKNPNILKSNMTPLPTYHELWQCLNSGREWRGEFVNKKKNGELYWESASIGPIKNAAGVVTHFIAVKEDITERKKAEGALRKAEEDLRRLFADALEGIFRASPEGRFLVANPAAARILGYNSTQEFVAAINDVEQQIWETPEERQMVMGMIAERGTLRGHECKFRKKDGSTVWVSLNIQTTATSDGQTEYYQGYFEDITEVRRDREALEETYRKLARSMESLKRRSEEITSLSEFARLLQSCLCREEAYQIARSYCQKLFPDFKGGVYLTLASRDMVEVATTWGEDVISQPNFRPDECWALRSGRPHSVDKGDAPAQCAHMSQGDGLAYLCLPLLAQGEAMGILHLEFPSDGAGMNDEDWVEFRSSRRELAGTVAEHVALALANLQLRETLRSQSIRDPLTGLFNRRYMEESLEREILRSSRNKQTIGILLLDIDHFKRYNDTFGHESGDTVLREVGELLQGQVRGEDTACRFGGEEFLLILPGAPREVVLQRAEAIRESVHQLTLGFHGQPLGAITISIGAAIYPLQGRDAKSILAAADKALYTAKNSGRDRSVFATTVA